MSTVRRALRHDLRSPLAVILGRADLLLTGVPGPLEPAQRRSLEILIQHAERLDRELAAAADTFDRCCEPGPTADRPADSDGPGSA